MANHMRNGNARLAGERGFTYVALLLFVALSSAVLATTAMVDSQRRQRQRENELLWIGEQYRAAIERYYLRSPGAIKRYPEKLTDLMEDRRQLAITRYLRRIYRDPMTGVPEWGEVRAPDGGIMGVFSPSQDEPIKQAGFSSKQEDFEGQRRYSGWRFVYEPPVSQPAQTAPPK